MKVKPNFELHHNLYIIVDSNEKKKENNKKTCTFYKWEGGGGTRRRWKERWGLVQSPRQFHFIVKTETVAHTRPFNLKKTGGVCSGQDV
jgi:hypothetical protein